MPLLTKQELAAELKTPVTGVQALTRKRKIPCLRIGHRTVRYDLAAVLAALKKFEVQAAG